YSDCATRIGNRCVESVQKAAVQAGEPERDRPIVVARRQHILSSDGIPSATLRPFVAVESLSRRAHQKSGCSVTERITDPATIRNMIAEHGRWWHEIELAPGIIT